jgi:hypothetical protein
MRADTRLQPTAAAGTIRRGARRLAATDLVQAERLAQPDTSEQLGGLIPTAAAGLALSSRLVLSGVAIPGTMCRAAAAAGNVRLAGVLAAAIIHHRLSFGRSRASTPRSVQADRRGGLSPRQVRQGRQ